jgi:signal transduction histidine kinase/CheY-like chemotaxis protein
MRGKISKSIIIGGCLTCIGLLFLLVNYNKITEEILRHHEGQRNLIVEQTSVALREYFSHYEKDLIFLSAHNRVIFNTPDMGMLLERYYRANEGSIIAVTRIDESGRISGTYPVREDVLGMDVSRQPHNERILRDRKPVISDVFQTVQGYQAVAYAYPVFDAGKFKGCLTVLIPFEAIARRFFEPVGESGEGYPWVISEGGYVIYHPSRGLIGKEITRLYQDSPGFTSLITSMLKGEKGKGTYLLKPQDSRRRIAMHASFYPIRVGDTFWSLAVSTPDSSEVEVLMGYRWRLFLTVIILMALVAGFIILSLKNIRARREMEEVKRMEKALTESRNYFQGIIDSSPSVLITIDRDMTVTGWNKAAERIFAVHHFRDRRLSLGEVSPLFTLVEQEIRDAVGEGAEKTIMGVPFESGESDYYLNVTYFPFTENSREGVIRLDDVTESHLMTRQLLQAQKMEVVGTLAGGLAHDFNNVLGGIEGTVSLAEYYLNRTEEPEKEKLLSYFATLSKASKRASSVIDRLLSLSRMNSGEESVFDLNMALEEIYEICKNTLDKSVILDFHFLDGKALLKGDYYQIEHMLLNLCVNAEHAMTMMRPPQSKKGGVLTVALNPSSEQKPSWVITIRDTGVGMSERVRKQIFDPFFTTKEKAAGSGLGLIMVSNAVTGHHGTLTVDSTEGEGSLFTITLPAYHGEETAREHEHRENEVVLGEGKILIIDDESMVRDFTSEMLQLCGYEAVCVSGGPEGIALFQKRGCEFKGVLLDLSMPGMDGYEVFRELKKIDGRVPVILLSGFTGDKRIRMMIREGAVGFLQKPFSLTELSGMLQKLEEKE